MRRPRCRWNTAISRRSSRCPEAATPSPLRAAAEEEKSSHGFSRMPRMAGAEQEDNRQERQGHRELREAREFQEGRAGAPAVNEVEPPCPPPDRPTATKLMFCGRGFLTPRNQPDKSMRKAGRQKNKRTEKWQQDLQSTRGQKIMSLDLREPQLSAVTSVVKSYRRCVKAY
jgi:hypothetical protein